MYLNIFDIFAFLALFCSSVLFTDQPICSSCLFGSKSQPKELFTRNSETTYQVPGYLNQEFENSYPDLKFVLGSQKFGVFHIFIKLLLHGTGFSIVATVWNKKWFFSALISIFFFENMIMPKRRIFFLHLLHQPL